MAQKYLMPDRSAALVDADGRPTIAGQNYLRGIEEMSDRLRIEVGSGTPEAALAAPKGTIYLRLDGGAGTSFYVKESGTGNTGWVGK